MFISCEQEEVTLLSNAPEIELVSISSDTIVEFEDLFEIVINYKDGDGDIGFEESNQNALFFAYFFSLLKFCTFYRDPGRNLHLFRDTINIIKECKQY